MSSTDRQNRLLQTEDWKRIYQTFRNADFQSYDFDNLRRTMINYLRQNYPEDFNDYIESSEYLALIDLIAFLGQNLSFRIDLNARENFLETAERRESVLRLARLISYNPRRNQAANGLLKFETIKTTESLLDSTGLNLSGITIRWNDASNNNYFEQFTKILNSSLPVNNTVGRPLKIETIANISTEQYRFNAINTGIPVFGFTKSVDGASTRFEVVSTAIENGSIVEEPPLPGNNPSFLFRDDGQGPGSSNTGFFMHFRQGKLEDGVFSVANPTPNQIIDLDTANINNSDVWLYSVDSNGFETELWTKLEAVTGNNIIFNSLFKNIRNAYAVTTRISDRISLVFSDGVFGNLPAGNFRAYYRTSANNTVIVNPGDIRNVQIEIPYVSRRNTEETLTIGLSLLSTISNGRPSESNAEIKQNAPATYYTQNRLITAEDYNIGPLGVSQEVIKTKSVNRISSGISRYLDLKDATGRYSNTNLFANDGILYKEEFFKRVSFRFETQSDIEGVILNKIEPILASSSTANFYYEKYPKLIVSDLSATWRQQTSSTNRSTGKFTDAENTFDYTVGGFTVNTLRLIEPGTLCKFLPPVGEFFLPSGKLTSKQDQLGATSYKWSKVISVSGDGTDEQSDGAGAILFNDSIPSGAVLEQIVPKLSKTLVDDIKLEIIDRVFDFRDFALRYDYLERQWLIITAENINTINNFSLGKAGSDIGQNLDSSWIVYFKTDGEKYTVTYRNLQYVIESKDEIKFLFDGADRIYDPELGRLVKDKIDILSVNRKPDELTAFTRDFEWSIESEYRDSEGSIDNSKLIVEFYDSDDDGIFDDIELFDQIVNEQLNTKEKYIFLKKKILSGGREIFRYFENNNDTIIVKTNEEEIFKQGNTLSSYKNNQIFYLIEEQIFKFVDKIANRLFVTTDYDARIGRADLKFRYFHVANSNFRIDPSVSNIIDTYILTRSYDTQYRQFLNGAFDQEPLPPSSDQLFREYGQQLNSIKSISDEIIYHPIKYKPLFGEKANRDLQVTFKIVKNSGLVINNNELKSDIIESINLFFEIENWDFGDTFYFQELSAFVMNRLSPNLVSVVIVPKQPDQAFGSLFEIKSDSDEIFVNAAQVSEVEIIDEITASKLKANGAVVTSVDRSISGIQSSPISNLQPRLPLISGSSVSTTMPSSNGGSTQYVPPSSGVSPPSSSPPPSSSSPPPSGGGISY